jgi:hypothetical protein
VKLQIYPKKFIKKIIKKTKKNKKGGEVCLCRVLGNGLATPYVGPKDSSVIFFCPFRVGQPPLLPFFVFIFNHLIF